MVGKLEPVPLRDVWSHEALDFTKWLFNNIEILNEQLGLSLTAIEQEKSVGPFSVDILAEDSGGRPVIIENQLEKTDHDHLGKVLTYLSNLDAKVAIWISTNPRPEHITAINYLNEIVPQDTNFFLVKAQAFKIGDSKPAPLFTVEAGPSEERTAGGKVKKEFAEKDKYRYEFFEQLLTRCNEKTNLFSNVSPAGYQNWVNAGAGKMGLGWAMTIMRKAARVELYLAGPDPELIKQRYDLLLSHKPEIEETYGGPLIWDFKEGRKQHYVRIPIDVGGLDDADNWEDIQDNMIDKIIKLEKALRSHIKDLP